MYKIGTSNASHCISKAKFTYFTDSILTIRLHSEIVIYVLKTIRQSQAV